MGGYDMTRDAETVVKGIKSLPKEEALEVSLCLLTILLQISRDDVDATVFITKFRDALFEK